MKRIKKMVMGIVLGMFVFASSAISCYAATSQLTSDITASRIYAKFVYSEAGHRIQVVVSYQERNTSSGYTYSNSVSDTQFGSVTTATVSRNSPDGYRYTWGQAKGYVDGTEVASSVPVSI